MAGHSIQIILSQHNTPTHQSLPIFLMARRSSSSSMRRPAPKKPAPAPAKTQPAQPTPAPQVQPQGGSMLGSFVGNGKFSTTEHCVLNDQIKIKMIK